jgi:hypothetical protein
MWPVPLLNRLHVESAALLAAAAFFVAGFAALGRLAVGESASRVLAGRLTALGLPLALMLVPTLWAPNCAWMSGVGFFALFPGVTAVLAVASAMVIVSRRMRRPRTVLSVAGCAILILGPFFDLGFHPQFYTYNHVFGGVLGPLYDEQLAVRPGLFAFRGITLLWAALAALLAKRNYRLGAVAAVLLGMAYFTGGRLGINTGYDDLSRALPGLLRSEHFEIRFDPAHADSLRVREYRDAFEYEYARIADLLDVRTAAPILGYVYPDAEARARLTGARYTSVSPVWLARPQLHILDEGLETVFPHELVHVFSREFGLPVVNASTSVGLVEGLAVALEPPSGRPSADDLVSAASPATGLDVGARLPEVLSPWGFWTGRGGVSYTVAGSFVRYLLAVFGPEPLKKAYAWSTLERAYGRPVRDLVDGWRSHLESRPWVDVDAVSRARIRLGTPSLFERSCPHYVSPAVRYLRRGEVAWGRADTAQALRWAGRSLAAAPLNPAVLRFWSGVQVATGHGPTARDTLRARPDSTLSVSLRILEADFAQAEGDSVAAKESYRSILERLPRYARALRIRLALSLAALADPGAGNISLGVAQAPQSQAGRALAALLTPEAPLPAIPPGLPAWARRAWPAQQALRRASLLYRANDPSGASMEAEAAAESFRQVGDPAMAAYVRHTARRYGFAAELHSRDDQ